MWNQRSTVFHVGTPEVWVDPVTEETVVVSSEVRDLCLTQCPTIVRGRGGLSWSGPEVRRGGVCVRARSTGPSRLPGSTMYRTVPASTSSLPLESSSESESGVKGSEGEDGPG